MLKYLLLALVVLWLFYSPAVRKLVRGAKPEVPKKETTAQPMLMLTCAHCGAHFPADEAVSMSHGSTTLHFCCKEHLQRGAKRPD